jgi:hypothetical protein
LVAAKCDNKRALVMDRRPLVFPPRGGFAALAHDLWLSAYTLAIRCQHAASPPRTGMIGGRAFGINDRDLRAARKQFYSHGKATHSAAEDGERTAHFQSV